MSDINQKLLAVFQIEHKEHLEQIRSLLEHLQEGAGLSAGPALEETFRRAHSLKGAARAVGLRAVETLAHRLETLFARVRERSLPLNQRTLAVIHQVLDCTEDLVASSGEDLSTCDPAPVLEAIEQVLSMPAEAPVVPAAGRDPEAGTAQAPPIPPIEVVRVAAENLDRLRRSSGQLLAESLSQEHIAAQLNDLCRRISGLERERDRVREACAVPLRRLAAMPGLSAVARYVGLVDEQLRSLSSRARKIRLAQQRSSWALGHFSRQVQQEVCLVRMVPAETVFEGFRKMVRDLAREERKQVGFQVAGLEVQVDRVVLQALKDPVMHLLRNAVCHGVESPQERGRKRKDPTGVVSLRLEARGDRLNLAVEDDGRGIDVKAVAAAAVRKGLLSAAEVSARPWKELARLIFEPGLSTSRVVTDLAGRGMGLSVVYEEVRRLQGEVDLHQKNGSGTTIVLSVPLSISTHRLLLVCCQGQSFAIPGHAIERLRRVKIQEIGTVEGKPVVEEQGRPVPLARLAQALNLPQAGPPNGGTVLPVMILRSGQKRAAFVVDAFLAERESVVQDLGVAPARAGRTLGGILLDDGTVAVVLNPSDLLEALDQSAAAPAFMAAPVPEQEPPSILVVDDSITTRSLGKSILEAHGYRVRVAVDGWEALAQLRSEKTDLVIADLQMPRLDGFGLIEEMKKDDDLSKIPVIIVTSMERREDQERGLALGADAYIMKRKFDQRELLDTIRQIL